jgi:hypothetical protein
MTSTWPSTGRPPRAGTPALHDAHCFHAADTSGFSGGYVGGQPVATISVVRYGNAHGFLGLYIVDPAHRGQGLGLQLWQAGMTHLSGRTVGLDGVVAQQDNYRRSGFALAWRNARYEGLGNGAAVVDPQVVALVSLPLAQLTAYDLPLFGAPREAFLQAWVDQPGYCARVGGGWRTQRLWRPASLPRGLQNRPPVCRHPGIGRAAFCGDACACPERGSFLPRRTDTSTGGRGAGAAPWHAARI